MGAGGGGWGGVGEEIAKQMTWGVGRKGGGRAFFLLRVRRRVFFFFFLLRVRGRHAPGLSLTGAAPDKSTHSKKAPTTTKKTRVPP